MIENIEISKEKGNYYPADDVPEHLKKFMKRIKPEEAKLRSDLKKGDVVIVLEGLFASKRLIYLERIGQKEVLVCGCFRSNQVGLVKINEDYLLKTSTNLSLNINIDLESLKIFDEQKNKLEEMNDFIDSKIDNSVFETAKEIPFMNTYLSRPFEIDRNNDFYDYTF